MWFEIEVDAHPNDGVDYESMGIEPKFVREVATLNSDNISYFLPDQDGVSVALNNGDNIRVNMTYEEFYKLILSFDNTIEFG